MTSRLPNACAVFKLINKYLQAAVGRSDRIRHIEHADGGRLRLAALARRVITWHLSFEDLVLIALGIENQERSALLGEKLPSRKAPDMQHYLGCLKYEPAEDIALIEFCCNDYVRRKFLSS